MKQWMDNSITVLFATFNCQGMLIQKIALYYKFF